MTPDQHVTIAIILGVPLCALLAALIWLRWDDWRGMR